jgi:hypothetical protein
VLRFRAICKLTGHQPIVLKFRNVARKAFACFQAGQDSRPSDLEEQQLSILSGTSHVVFSGTKAQDGSPSNSSNDSSTPASDLHATLQEHFRAVEWQQQQYDPLNTMFDPVQSLLQTAPTLPAPSFIYQTQTSTESADDPLGLSAFPSLAPGQLPMPLDGVNFNFNVAQETSEDPLDFLSNPVANITSGQSWDYVGPS